MVNKSIKINFIMNMLLTVSSLVFPMITFPYVSRVLQPIGTGKVAFATSIISYFLLISQLGIPTYGIRACAKVRDDKEKLSRTVHEIFLINTITTLVSYVVFGILLSLNSKLSSDKALYVIVSLTIVLNTVGCEWLFKALEEYSYITIRSLIFKFVGLIITFLLVKSTKDYYIYAAITVFINSASNILNLFMLKKMIVIHPIKNINLKQHLKPIFVFFAMSCATTVYTNLDIIMLGFIKDDFEVGLYNSAIKIKSILVAVVTSLGAVILPRATYYSSKGLKKEFEDMCNKSLKFVLFLSLPCFFFFIFFAKETVLILFGKEYIRTISTMQILMPTVLLIGISNILGMQVLVPKGFEKIVLFSEILGALTDLVVNFILIPLLSLVGAGIGTLIAELVVLLIQYIYIKKKDIVIIRGLEVKDFILASIIALIIPVFIKVIFNNKVLVLSFALLSYGFIYVMVLLCFFRQSDVVEVKNKMFCWLKGKL